MPIAKVFYSGNSQAVRLPKEFRFAAAEVEIFRRDGDIVLREKCRGLSGAFKALSSLRGLAFDLPRIDPPPQKRHGI